jgi:DNA-binding winged helix-turn-helix (wHTH) protein/tetratricopeptide (TPR) repeat protein
MQEAFPSDGKPQAIDLAHQPDFSLGLLTVKPSTREIVRPDGARDVLEPRVMQVLVALHRAAPEVVSRDDLIAQCWDGRIVGDDAMNGAIGKLRRLANADQGASFVIETIPRVGYRLTVAGAPQEQVTTPHHSEHHPPGGNRRSLLAGGVAFGAVAVAGGGWWLATRRSAIPAPPPQPAVSPAVATLIRRGNEAIQRGGLENEAEGAGLFQEAIDLSPDNADAWGGLALADAFLAHNGAPDSFQAQHMRALSAIDKAMALDPRNPLAWQAKAVAYPARGAWFEAEMALRQGLKFHPDNDGLLLVLANYLLVVGREREAAQYMTRAIAAVSGHINPAIAWISIAIYNCAGQWEEADRAAARGLALFPRHPLTWIHRIYLLMFSGRAAEALATLRDVDNRPSERPSETRQDDIRDLIVVVQAMDSGARADIDKAAAVQLARARKGSNRDAENAFMFLSALGRLDDAFAVANACYLAPAANVQPVRLAPNLFMPGCRAMRKDARFAGLMAKMGFTDYWRRIGAKPDYQIYPDG